MRVLLLGGTGEARALAAVLAGAGVDVESSLAGRSANTAASRGSEPGSSSVIITG